MKNIHHPHSEPIGPLTKKEELVLDIQVLIEAASQVEEMDCPTQIKATIELMQSKLEGVLITLERMDK